MKEICSALDKFSKYVCSNFLIPSTDSMHRNGKVSGIVHKISTALRLHPVLYMNRNRLKVWHIEVGNMQRARRRYVRKLLRRREQIDTRVLFLTYAGCSVRQLDELLEEVQKYISFQNIFVQKASATVSSNCGVGTFGLIFIRLNDLIE